MKVVPRSGRARLRRRRWRRSCSCSRRWRGCGGRACCPTPTTWPRWGTPTAAAGPRTGHDHHGHGTPVADLVADPDRPGRRQRDPDRPRRTVTGYTVNGTSPGPGARGDRGRPGRGDPGQRRRRATAPPCTGTASTCRTPMDGVAGVTQDAVLPGESFTYRFVADQAGTYWYHSHQVSHEQVRKGVLGALVVEPRQTADRRASVEAVAVLHRYGSTADPQRRGGRADPSTCEPGDEVRVRVVNTDNALMPVWVTGAPYRGARRRRHRPERARRRSSDVAVKLTAGGRVDLGVVVPDGGRPGRLRGHHGPGARRRPDRRQRAPGSRDESSTCCPTASPADLGFDPDPARPELRLPHRQAAGLPRRPARACGGRSTATCSPTCRCTWSTRATSWCSTSRTSSGDDAPDAPARPPRGRAVPRRRAGDRQPVVGRLARGRRRRELRDRLRRRQPRASGWTTATTCRTRPRGWSRT